MLRTPYIAIDLETADDRADSICAVGMVRFRDGIEESAVERLVRPPRRSVPNRRIHGIAWADVKNQPTFLEIWSGLMDFYLDNSLWVAHNAVFDRTVLQVSCQAAGLRAPEAPFLCTLRLSQACWPHLGSYGLSAVCDFLAIPLQHHNALSDARASGLIVQHAVKHWMQKGVNDDDIKQHLYKAMRV